MWSVNARDRLCQEVMGAEFAPGLRNPVTISLPVHDTEITAGMLMAAQEAIYTHSPAQTRQMLPFVLYVLEQGDMGLIESGYFSSFLLHVNADFVRPLGPDWDKQRYSSEYRQGYVALSVSALTRFEQGWAFDWAKDILDSATPVVQTMFAEDLTMLCRVLAMALDKAEADAPTMSS